MAEAARTLRYDAFISYSHAADGQFAPALRDGLQRFATPFGPLRWRNPVRSLRIFQDQASLSANPGLWPTIKQALAASEWFVLLASPDAAQSPWIEKEVDYWCCHKQLNRLLIVRTDGDIVWHHTANDFDWLKTTALPKRLSMVLPTEPRWVDASFARTAMQVSLRDPRFRNLIAELAAPLRAIPKDELISDDIRQHRRLNAWRNAALGIVTTLLLCTAAAAIIALERQQFAERQRDEALVAESTALAALSREQTDSGNATLGMLLALHALPVAVDQNDRPYVKAAEAALLHGIFWQRELRVLRGHEKTVKSAEFSPDGRYVLTASADGTARIWSAATGKAVAVLSGHPRGLRQAKFSPNGRSIGTASLDHTARLWDTESGQSISILRGHTSPVEFMAFSPDGRKVATASRDNTAIVWDIKTGKPDMVLKGHDGPVSWVAFFHDGRRLVTSSMDGTIRIWDTHSGKAIIKLEHHEGRDLGTVAALSHDDRWVATGARDGFTVRLWDAATGELVASLNAGDSTSLVFSPDGKGLVSTSGNRVATLWDVPSRAPIAVLRGHENVVEHAVFSTDGSLLITTSWDHTARLWDGFSGSLIGILPGHQNWVEHAAFSPDGSAVVTASADQTARLWRTWAGTYTVAIAGGAGGRDAVFSPGSSRLAVLLADPRQVQSLFSDPTNLQFARSDEIEKLDRKLSNIDRTLQVIDLVTGEIVSELRGLKGMKNRVLLSPDGKRISVVNPDHGTRLILWDLDSGSQITAIEHQASISDERFSPDSQRIVTLSERGALKLWDASTGALVTQLNADNAPVTVYDISPRSDVIAACSTDRKLRIWDTESGQLLKSLPRPGDKVAHISFSSNSEFLVLDDESGNVDVWHIGSGARRSLLQEQMEKHQKRSKFSPRSDRVVTFSQGKVYLWETSTGVLISTLAAEGSDNDGARKGEGYISEAVFSPDGRWLMSFGGWGEASAVLWNAADGRSEVVLRGHKGDLRSVTFSPDSRRVLTTSEDGTARVWDVASGEAITTLSMDETDMRDAAFTSDGQRIVTFSEGAIAVWEVYLGSGQELINYARSLVPRHLTVEEQLRYLGSTGRSSG